MNTKLAAWLADVVADEVLVAPANVCTEAQQNQWGFSVTSEEATALSISDIVTFISAVVRARCDALMQRDVPRGSMTFYCWFDEMASQLRFSIVSAKRYALPFVRMRSRRRVVTRHSLRISLLQVPRRHTLE